MVVLKDTAPLRENKIKENYKYAENVEDLFSFKKC